MLDKRLLLCVILATLSSLYYFTRTIVVPAEFIAVQNHWLNSVNIFLQTGMLLVDYGDRTDPQHGEKTFEGYYRVPLEESIGGDDQGYPFLLSIFAKIFQNTSITYEFFIRFNYVALILFGISSSIILYRALKSIVVSSGFYVLYLFTQHFYDGWVYHHWMGAVFITFYLVSIILFIKQPRLKDLWLYFFIAGWAGVIRTGYDFIGLILFLAAVSFYYLQNMPSMRFTVVLKKQLMILALLYILPGMLLGLVRDIRDLTHFGGKKSDLPPTHLLWHHAFLGLGYTENPYGIIYDDKNPMIFARRIEPQARLYSYESDKILRNLYIEYALKHPDYWLHNIFVKIQGIHKFLVDLVSRVLPFGMLNNLVVYGVFFAIYLLAKREERLILRVLAVAACLTALPGIIASPIILYLKGLQAVVFMAFVYLGILIYKRYLG